MPVATKWLKFHEPVRQPPFGTSTPGVVEEKSLAVFAQPWQNSNPGRSEDLTPLPPLLEMLLRRSFLPSRTLSCRLATACLLVASAQLLPSFLAASSDVPEGVSLLGQPSIDAFALTASPGNADAIRISRVEVDGPGFNEALRIETVRDVSPYWSLRLEALNTGDVSRGGAGLIRLHMRTLSTNNESGKGHLWTQVQPARIGAGSSLDMLLSSGSEWQEFLLPFSFNRDLPAGEAAIRFYFGFRSQVIEVGGIDVTYYGDEIAASALPQTRFTYPGREADAEWRKTALERIEEFRKGEMTIVVRDAAGEVLEGAEVHVRQTSSAFEFGTAVTLTRLSGESGEYQTYRDTLLRLFNSATPENDLKWPVWLGEWNELPLEGPPFSQEASIEGLQWLKKHAMNVRGHVLVWPGWGNLPKALKRVHEEGRTDEIPGIIEKHIRDIAASTEGLIDEWDALNEPYTNHDLMDMFGPEIMVDWFRVAREAMPGLDLYLNDFSNHDHIHDADHVAHFEETARFLLKNGAPLDGLGLQAHFGAEPNAPEVILETLDRYADLDLPIRFTEFDIWTSDEELQADFTRDFLILAYSHPSVEGVHLWGFWEGAHWRPSAAMFRRDWSAKPNLHVYEDLVLNKWRTEATGKTDEQGRFVTRGFHGAYRVTVKYEGHTVEETLFVDPNKEDTRVEVQLSRNRESR